MATEGVVSLVAGDFHRAFIGLVSNSIGLASAYRGRSSNKQRLRRISDTNVTTDGHAENEAATSDAHSHQDATSITDQETNSTLLPTSRPLPQIVILPQRRPGVRKRGFLRAYAPVLQGAGIDQGIFLRFLDDFDAAAKANPAFTVVALAAEVVGMVPEAICMAVSACVKLAADVGAEMQGRRRMNGFLDRMNEEFFMPRGVYAMIMKYRPAGDKPKRKLLGQAAGDVVGVEVGVEDVRAAEKVEEKLPGPEAKSKNKFSIGTARTEGVLELPESAQLVYLDDVESEADLSERQEQKVGFKEKIKSKTAWASDYLDKRAHMNLAARDGDAATLTVPEERRMLSNSYADPKNKIYHHPMIKLALGGIPTNMSFGSKSKSSRDETSNAWFDPSLITVSTELPGQALIKNALMENLLYLAIVNLPSKEDLQKAQEKIDVIVAAELES